MKRRINKALRKLLKEPNLYLEALPSAEATKYVLAYARGILDSLDEIKKI